MQSLPRSRENASISSRITTVILVVNDYQINDNCFNEPFAVSSYKDCTDHMHGLAFETSIYYWQDQPGECTCKLQSTVTLRIGDYFRRSNLCNLKRMKFSTTEVMSLPVMYRASRRFTLKSCLHLEYALDDAINRTH